MVVVANAITLSSDAYMYSIRFCHLSLPMKRVAPAKVQKQDCSYDWFTVLRIWVCYCLALKIASLPISAFEQILSSVSVTDWPCGTNVTFKQHCGRVQPMSACWALHADQTSVLAQGKLVYMYVPCCCNALWCWMYSGNAQVLISCLDEGWSRNELQDNNTLHCLMRYVQVWLWI